MKTIKTTLKTFTLSFALLAASGQSAVANENISQELANISSNFVCTDSPTRCEIQLQEQLAAAAAAAEYSSQESETFPNQESATQSSAFICADSPTRCE
ncbi:hypothetical protein SG35_001490 [Thalassomonas actiniarum]|uniref:Uncharacterized protein n=2 Tax=Thalassomonas actiniarum TaxID=485447 RepID=A0AAE9YQU3_9GAMM|nr:hypothetical protein SG35_001490 [Thalassomonas actiniarum]